MEKRILVLRLSSLGDVVLTTPVFRNLKAHWPDARVCAMVKPQFQALLASNPFIDEVIPYRGLTQALRVIRGQGFTHLLDLHATWRTFWLRSLSAVPNTVRYRKDALARRLFVLFGWTSPALAKHTLDRYLESLAAWGVPVKHRELTLGDYSSSRPGAGAPPSARILLEQTSFLGDTLLTIPLARRIKQILPDSRLTVLTRPQTADLFRRCAEVDEVLEDDKRGRHAGLRGLLTLARELKSGGFDLAIVPHRSLRSALAAWLARIPRRIGFSSSAGAFLFHETVYFSWGMPDLERNLALLLPLKPDLRSQSSDAVYLNGSGEAAAGRVEGWLKGSGGPWIGLHPGSAWPTKRWMPEAYARLAGRLTRELGARVLLMGGKEDVELAARIAKESGVEVLDLVGRTSLPELLELSRRLDLLVTNDSGPMHVAAAHGVPTLALFGPTTRELGFFPYGEGHRVLEKDLPCRPCGLHGSRACPEGHFLCMRLITVEEVFRNAAEMLETRRAALQ